MTLFHLFDSLAQHDADIHDRVSTRRASIKHLSDVGRKAGMTSLALFLGGVLQQAYAGGNRTTAVSAVVDTVKFAYQLEKAELGLYTQARALGTFSAANRAALDVIFANEDGHVAALAATLKNLGLSDADLANPMMFPPRTADLTGSANATMTPLEPNALTDEMACISVLCGSEENGGRAYRGNAYTLKSNPDVLQAALQIHSVETCHATHWREVLGRMVWIQTGDLTQAPNFKVPAMVYAKTGTTTNGLEYPNESNATQAGKAGSVFGVSADRVAVRRGSRHGRRDGAGAAVRLQAADVGFRRSVSPPVLSRLAASPSARKGRRVG